VIHNYELVILPWSWLAAGLGWGRLSSIAAIGLSAKRDCSYSFQGLRGLSLFSPGLSTSMPICQGGIWRRLAKGWSGSIGCQGGSFGSRFGWRAIAAILIYSQLTFGIRFRPFEGLSSRLKAIYPCSLGQCLRWSKELCSGWKQRPINWWYSPFLEKERTQWQFYQA
jgi:hypothetical protein